MAHYRNIVIEDITYRYVIGNDNIRINRNNVQPKYWDFRLTETFNVTMRDLEKKYVSITPSMIKSLIYSEILQKPEPIVSKDVFEPVIEEITPTFKNSGQFAYAVHCGYYNEDAGYNTKYLVSLFLDPQHAKDYAKLLNGNHARFRDYLEIAPNSYDLKREDMPEWVDDRMFYNRYLRDVKFYSTQIPLMECSI